MEKTERPTLGWVAREGAISLVYTDGRGLGHTWGSIPHWPNSARTATEVAREARAMEARARAAGAVVA